MMTQKDFLSSHPLFGIGDARTGLEREIIDYEGHVCFVEECMRHHPDDPEWKEWRDKHYEKMKELQHQWRKEHKLLSEVEAEQLTFDFDG